MIQKYYYGYEDEEKTEEHVDKSSVFYFILTLIGILLMIIAYLGWVG